MPVLTAEQYQFGDNGILLNGPSTYPFTDVDKIQGLDSTPIRLTTRDRVNKHGSWIDARYETIRTVVIDCTSYTDPNYHDVYMDQLKANFGPSDLPVPFYFTTDNGNRVLYCKSQGLRYTKDSDRGFGKQAWQVILLAGDPRVYTPGIVTSGPIYLGSSVTGGRGYPKGYPFGYGAAAAISAGTITVSGNRGTPAQYIITGPIINPGIANDTLGMIWQFAGLSLGAGETLYIDSAATTVRRNSATGPSNRKYMGGMWWDLQNGQNNFRLLGSGGTAGVTNLVINAQSAWR